MFKPYSLTQATSCPPSPAKAVAKQQFRDPIAKNYDKLGAIMAYEAGTLTDKEAVKLFQYLIDTGEVWQLQGSYGRTAAALIDAGQCHSSR